MSGENSWVIEKLTKANHEKWFRLMKAKIQSKEVMHVLNMSMEDYARVISPDPKEAENNDMLEELTVHISKLSIEENNLSANSPRSRIFLNIEKKRRYIRDEGTLTFLLLQALDDDDQALLDDYQTPRALWNYIFTKYSKPSKLAASQYTKEINNFEFSTDVTIAEAWSKL